MVLFSSTRAIVQLASESNVGLMLCRLNQTGIEPPTCQSAGDLLYLGGFTLYNTPTTSLKNPTMISKSDWEPVQIKLNQISMKWEEGRTAARHCAVEQGMGLQ